MNDIHEWQGGEVKRLQIHMFIILKVQDTALMLLEKDRETHSFRMGILIGTTTVITVTVKTWEMERLWRSEFTLID